LEILYISQYFTPECCAPAARVDDLTREWARLGHRVRVLTGFPNHPEGVLHPDYRRHWRRGLYKERHGDVEVYRTWLYPAPNRGVWGRAANYASFALSATVVGPWITPRKSVVIATSPQLLVGVAGYLVARARRLPFVFEVRDLWPQSIDAVGATGQRSLLYRTLDGVANFLYRRADRIVLDGEWKRRELVAQGVPAEKTAVIRNGVAEDFALDPESEAAREVRRKVRREQSWDGKFVVVYVGTLGMAHGLETVLHAANRLRECPQVAFVLIGEGAERDRLTRQAHELSLENVTFLRKHPREMIPAFLTAADACLVPLRRKEVFKTAIPSKMFEAMAAAKPIMLGVEGEAREILCEAQAGVAFPPEDSHALAEAIHALRNQPELCRNLGKNGRRAVLEKYSRRSQAKAYLRLLSDLAGACSGSHSPGPLSVQEPAWTSTEEAMTLRKQ
jgi:glycosyltransferase involved in cell wall biosynthesis